MYISKIYIRNYRNFKDLNVDFNDGVNVIIGHNNAGKSNLIKSLSLIFDSNARKQLGVNDFNKYITLEDLKREPPKISITAIITQSKDENIMSDDLVTVSNWLTRLEEPYEAQLTYEFFLPNKEHDKYNKRVLTMSNKEEIWNLISDEFIRLYTYKIWGGNLSNQTIADGESLKKFDFQFLNAIRDVERDMLTGRNPLLKSILDFFMDYEIKSDVNISDEEKLSAIKSKKYEFDTDVNDLIKKLQSRMIGGKQQILSYAKDIGASFDRSSPDVQESISDIELYSALGLIIEYETGIKIPVSYNGLGYNNLIYISLLLSKMQVNSDGKYLGSNAKVFPMLLIEEPEAHLHPAMQYQFLRFLKKNKDQNKVRQIFITTHSTHITASVSLDQIICLYKRKNQSYVGYPGKAFLENKKSKNYVQRFLDATRSDMLFADKVIFVEGIAEQLLLYIFAQYLGMPLEENHVAVINVGGRYFQHFLYLFDSRTPFAIDRKVACLTDKDPERRLKGSDNRFKKCYPFEYNFNKDKYEYRQNIYLQKYENFNHPNIVAFTQDKVFGKTFEYELILANPYLELLITDSMGNKDEIKKLMKAYREEKSLSKMVNLLRESDENKRITESISKKLDKWTEDNKKRALIAARYLNSVGKGENALELAYVFKENLENKGTEKYQEFNVPKYIDEAIRWVCEE